MFYPTSDFNYYEMMKIVQREYKTKTCTYKKASTNMPIAIVSVYLIITVVLIAFVLYRQNESFKPTEGSDKKDEATDTSGKKND